MILMIAGGLGMLVWGSSLVIRNSVEIARGFGISERIIGLTIISAGTSFPELVTSVVAAIRKKSDIAIGNVVGSNIFNISLIYGLSALIHPVAYNVAFNFDFILLLGATLLIFGAMFSSGRYKLDRWEAAILFIVYAGYMLRLIIH